jgi:hypothetical protein
VSVVLVAVVALEVVQTTVANVLHVKGAGLAEATRRANPIMAIKAKSVQRANKPSLAKPSITPLTIILARPTTVLLEIVPLEAKAAKVVRAISQA